MSIDTIVLDSESVKGVNELVAESGACYAFNTNNQENLMKGQNVPVLVKGLENRDYSGEATLLRVNSINGRLRGSLTITKLYKAGSKKVRIR